MSQTKTLAEAQEIIQDSLDYTLFSWSKQKGIAPIAVKYGEGVYLFDYDGKRYIDFSSGLMNVQFDLNKPANLLLTVTDVIGNTVKTLFDGVHSSGKQTYSFDMNEEGWTNGIYIVHAKTGNKDYYVKLVKM